MIRNSKLMKMILDMKTESEKQGKEIESLKNQIGINYCWLFDLQFPDGKLEGSGYFSGNLGFYYRYTTCNEIQTRRIFGVSDNKELDTTKPSIFKDQNNVFFKFEFIEKPTKYFLLNKNNNDVTEVPENLFENKADWKQIDIMK